MTEQATKTKKDRIIEYLTPRGWVSTFDLHRLFGTSARTRISEINAGGKHRIEHANSLTDDPGKPGESWYRLVSLKPEFSRRGGTARRAKECLSGGALVRREEAGEQVTLL